MNPAVQCLLKEWAEYRPKLDSIHFTNFYRSEWILTLHITFLSLPRAAVNIKDLSPRGIKNLYHAAMPLLGCGPDPHHVTLYYPLYGLTKIEILVANATRTGRPRKRLTYGFAICSLCTQLCLSDEYPGECCTLVRQTIQTTLLLHTPLPLAVIQLIQQFTLPLKERK